MAKGKGQKAKVDEAAAPVPTFTLRADRDGDLRALLAAASVTDRHDIHAAVREFEGYVNADAE